MKGLSYLFSQNQIMMVHGIIGDRAELGYIYLSILAQHRFINADIEDSLSQIYLTWYNEGWPSAE